MITGDILVFWLLNITILHYLDKDDKGSPDSAGAFLIRIGCWKLLFTVQAPGGKSADIHHTLTAPAHDVGVLSYRSWPRQVILG